MKKHPILAVALSALAFVPHSTLLAITLLDPALTEGDSIDPIGEQTVEQNATSPLGPLVGQGTLETLPGFAAIPSVISSWSPQGTPNYIVFSDPNRPDVKSIYGGLTGSSPGGQMNIPELRTSPGISMGVDSGGSTSGVIVFDFGNATVSGTAVSSFDSAAAAPSAVGFTVSGLARVTSNVTIQYFGTDDTTVLDTQTLVPGSETNGLDLPNYGADGYTGFRAQGSGVASGIGRIVVTANTLIGGNHGIAIDDFAYDSTGKAYYMTVSGTGLMNGSSWAHALPKSLIVSILHTQMVAGDTLFLGSGNYGDLNLDITTSGSAGKPKSIIGQNTGGGLPLLTRSAGDPGSSNASIAFTPGVSYWTISNLRIQNYIHGVHSATSSTPRVGLVFRNLDIQAVTYGFYLSDCDTLTIEGCSVKNYTKHGFRLESGCDVATFTNCTADLSDGVDSRFATSLAHPAGFILEGAVGGTNKNVSFYNCVAKNNRRNNQNNSYWNGDGFLVNGNNSNILFERCLSKDNDDAGFDIKPAATYNHCVTVRNYHGFKAWYGNHNLFNCVATFPFARRDTDPNGTEYGTFIHIPEEVGTANIVANYFTGYGKATKALFENFNGVITSTNSVIVMSGSSKMFVSGSVRMTNSSTYHAVSGAGTNPAFSISSTATTWSGTGTELDSGTFNLTKGYNSTR